MKAWTLLDTIKESDLYKAIVRKGKAREAQKLLLLMGRSRLGELPLEAVPMLGALTDLRQLEALAVALLDVSSWQELLGLDGSRWPSPRAAEGVRCPEWFDPALWRALLDLEESSTYQATLQEGAVAEARTMLLLMGRSRLGWPPPEAVAALDALTDVSRLEELAVRLLQASSWQELLGLNGPIRRGRGRRNPS